MINARQTINHKGLELVKHFEGCSLSAYKDEAGVWTIGYGHTGLQQNDGKSCAAPRHLSACRDCGSGESPPSPIQWMR